MRAVKDSGSTYAIYFNENYTLQNPAGGDTLVESKHIFLGETRIVTKRRDANNENTAQEAVSLFYYHGDHLGSANLVTDYRGGIIEHIEYTPYGELWMETHDSSKTAETTPYRFTGKELDAETGLYYYGARYLDPKTSRWLSTDPAMGEYVPGAPVNDEVRRQNQNLPGMGGVFNYVNLHVYHYAGNNPVVLTDPDGNTTEIDESTGKVMNVTDDGSTQIFSYKYNDGEKIGEGNFIGDSYRTDTFEKGNIVHMGIDKTDVLYRSAKTKWEPNVITAFKSRSGGKYDIKKTWGYGSGDGFIFEDKYATMRDFGNILAGLNAKIGGPFGNISFDKFQRMAGALHARGNMGAVIFAFLGKEYGPAPYYGEVERQHWASHMGYNSVFGTYSNWKSKSE
jgi:RHS repeat-associated protein